MNVDTVSPQVVVGAIVIHDGRLLMVRRANEPSKGMWTVPGGRVEPGEYLTAAAAREVREETGVAIDVGELLGVLEVIGDEHHFVIHDYIATVIGDPEAVAADDAEEVRWVPLAEVASLPCTPRFVETLTGWGVLTPSED
jgi:8-oxo-dGTP diphosphatase